jgi:DNA-binding NarL/FixJ family response regulator
MTDKIRIAMVDDQQLFRKAIATVLRETEDFDLMADQESGNNLLDWLKELPEQPDIILVDLDMPVMNGVQLNEILQAQYPAIKVIILTVHNQERFISKMIDAGANGYLAKNCDIEELIAAIRIVHKTGFYFNNDCLLALKNAASHRNKKLRNINNIPFEITGREHEILLLLCQEYTTAEIAEKLFLSGRTVEGHRNNLLAKIGCRNMAGIIIFAIKNGIYEPWLG